MTRKEAINKWIIPAIKNTWNAKKCKEILEALEQEPIDYKTQYENYLKKSEVVISQLRADRNRLQDAFDKIRSEIEQLPTTKCTETHRIYIDADDFKENVLTVLDKYEAESET